MHGVQLCDLALTLQFTVESPLHIGSGDAGAAEAGEGRCRGKLNTDANRARTPAGYTLHLQRAKPDGREVALPLHRPGAVGPEFFVPASSLRGALRAFLRRRLERALAGREWSPTFALDPHFEARDDSNDPGDPATAAFWSRRFGDPLVRHLFGTTKRAGVLGLRDAVATPAAGTAIARYAAMRTPVQGGAGAMPVLRLLTSNALDRFTMASTIGLRNVAALEVGTVLTTTLTVRSFAWWQVGAIAVALDGMNDGRLTLGTRRAVGLGRLTAKVTAMSIRYSAIAGVTDTSRTLPGVGALLGRLDTKLADAVRGAHRGDGVTTMQAFVIDEADQLTLPASVKLAATPGLLSTTLTLTDKDLSPVLTAASARLAAVARQHSREVDHAA